MPSCKFFVVGLVAAIHSFVIVSAAENPLITPAPTPIPEHELARRQVAGAPGTPILSTLHFPFSDIPEQVYPFAVLRGPQFGFNICNDTTLGPTSNCQTLIFNDIRDFCLWGSPTANGQIGDVEAKVVAYCTKDTHGTRVIPPGAITGLQWTKTSAYIQVSGFISNTGIGLDPTDQGGELDPHGADLQGNPLGGIVYSNGTADATNGTEVQVFNWNTFVGAGQFCFKACFNSITSPDYCENRYDLVGCNYNMPGDVQNGTFTECDGDLQDVVGTYTSDGQTLTWSMPATLTGPPPYTPRIPASSNCQTFHSTDLFAAAPTSSSGVSSSPHSSSSSPSSAPFLSSPSQSNSATTTGGASHTGSSGATGSRSGSAAGAANTNTSGAISLSASIGLMGVMAGIGAILL